MCFPRSASFDQLIKLTQKVSKTHESNHSTNLRMEQRCVYSLLYTVSVEQYSTTYTLREVSPSTTFIHFGQQWQCNAVLDNGTIAVDLQPVELANNTTIAYGVALHVGDQAPVDILPLIFRCEIGEPVAGHSAVQIPLPNHQRLFLFWPLNFSQNLCCRTKI